MLCYWVADIWVVSGGVDLSILSKILGLLRGTFLTHFDVAEARVGGWAYFGATRVAPVR